MKRYTANLIKIDGTKITLDVDGKTMTADFSKWEGLMKLIGGEANVSKVTLLGKDTLEFPNDTHVEIEDFVELAKQQRVLKERKQDV